MSEMGRIVIADDEETFLVSTAELLRNEGYDCDCALDSASATALLRKSEHDLLIADIKMPGNYELEFVRAIPQIAQGLPVILVTGNASLDTAIQSIQMPVVGYLLKPIDFDQMLMQVRNAVKSYRVFRSVRELQERIRNWDADLTAIRGTLGRPPSSLDAASVDTFLELTFKNILDIISDLSHLSKTFAMQNSTREVCHLFKCPRLEIMTEAIQEAIYVLQKTKNSFKSKDLARVRISLQRLMKQAEEYRKEAP